MPALMARCWISNLALWETLMTRVVVGSAATVCVNRASK